MTARFPEQPRHALFAGSFNPFTAGHASVLERALQLFDKVTVAVGVNRDKPASHADALVDAIRDLYAGDSRVDVIRYSGELTVDLAARIGARWLVRGVRSVKDFEYERDMADINRRLGGLETVVFPRLPEHGAISSSLLRELASYGRDISEFLPQPHNP